MKVYISKYRNHWLSPYTIAEKLCFWREVDYDEPWVDRFNNVMHPVMSGVKSVLDFVHPRVEYVKIDESDTWGMDATLALIVLPMLKQLQREKHGAPWVDDGDVPVELRSTSALPKEDERDTDSNHFKRWDYVLDEMIWAFEQQLSDDGFEQFCDSSMYDDDHDQWFNDIKRGKSKVKVDYKGWKAWEKRKLKGFMLFGKYYQNLWD